MVHGFTFECSKVWSKDAFGHCNVCMPNEAVGNQLQIGDFGKLAHSWEHDYVLNFLGKECIMILTLGVLLLAFLDSDECPCT
jgi:hypothetical protein